MAREKRKHTRIPKSERKNLRFWAEGARETILAPHLDQRKYLKTVCNEFHARVDWKLQDHEEPVLTDFDPKAFLPPQNLPEDEEKAKCARVEVLNQRIRRWFLYRLRKLGSSVALVASTPLKIPTPSFLPNCVHRESRTCRGGEMGGVIGGGSEPGPHQRAKGRFRAQIAREVFAGLEEDERREIGARAKEEATEKKAAYQKALKNPPSKQPNDRQKCIDTLPEFVGPILRGIQEATGMHTVLLCGGPVPKYGGELRTVHVAYGQNHTAGAHTWPQWNKTRFTNEVLNFLTEYLQTAFILWMVLIHVKLPSSVRCVTGTGRYLRRRQVYIPTNNSDSESDSDSDIESDIDLQSDSEDESDEEILPKKKKRKVDTTGQGKKKAPSEPTPSGSTTHDSPPPTIWRNEDGLTFDQVREKNMAQHRALAEQLKASFEEKFPELKKPEPKKRAPRKPKESTGGPTPTRSISDLSNVPSRSSPPPDSRYCTVRVGDSRAMDVDAATDNEAPYATSAPEITMDTQAPVDAAVIDNGRAPPQRPTRRPRPPCSPLSTPRHPPRAVIGTIADPTAALIKDALQAPDPPPALHPLSTPPLITAAPHLTCCTLSTRRVHPSVMDTATVIAPRRRPHRSPDRAAPAPAPAPLSTPPSLITAAPCRTHPHPHPLSTPAAAIDNSVHPPQHRPAIRARDHDPYSYTVRHRRQRAWLSDDLIRRGPSDAAQMPAKSGRLVCRRACGDDYGGSGLSFPGRDRAWTRVEAASKYEKAQQNSPPSAVQNKLKDGWRGGGGSGHATRAS
ncbi:hypothetical protein B0H13DRAFT_1883061 [Mycena leptocephala]|nr:hypothetical protein B0H13DRAFT_1883061 [Mycena leptocephala]